MFLPLPLPVAAIILIVYPSQKHQNKNLLKQQIGTAFVDGQMIRGIKELLFAVLRDIVYTANEVVESGRFDLTRPQSITNAVFHILRNARLLEHKARPNLIVCWGGHSINREEYEYTKKVGYELGLRGLIV